MISLAIDLGGTHIKVGVVVDGAVAAFRRLPAESRVGLAARLPAIEAAIQELGMIAGVDPRQAAGVGVAVPALVEPGGRRILSGIDKYPDAAGFDFGQWARGRFGLEIALENDANAALLGETCAGAGRGHANLVFIALGTGVGTAALIEGRLLRGQHGQAGCLGGHFTVCLDGRECVCGNRGCVEAEASTWALPELAREDPGFARSALAEASVLDYEAVFADAAAGDALALTLRDRSLQVWAAAAVTLIHAYDPDVVVLGGGVLRSPEPTLSVIQDYVDVHAWTGWGRVPVIRGVLGDRAALVGLAALVAGIERARPAG